MDNNQNYFKSTYKESREEFLELAKSTQGELQTHEVSADLFFESLYLPPLGQKKRLLILTSGIHGIEGFTGSALQRKFLSNNCFDLQDDETGILIIHGINPYGFKNERRVTESNIDLNRNFDDTDKLFQTENPGYANLYQFLNPERPYSKILFRLKAIYYILKFGMENLRSAILRGQYQFPEGIFFGGRNFEPQVLLLRDILLKRGEGFEKVLLVDLHTGYGQRGKLHLFGDRSPFIDQTYMEKVFKGLSVDFGQEKDFYAVTGGFTVFVAKLFHKTSKFAGIVFEFGTIDSHKTSGSLDSLYRMINEKYDKEMFREMFYPSSPEWRNEVMEQFEAYLKKIAHNFTL
jgi:hypothetical protein